MVSTFLVKSPSLCIKGVIICLVNRVLKICSHDHVKTELDYVKDILFWNGYLINLIENITFTTLQYVSKLSDKLEKKIERNLSVSFETKQKVEHFFNSGKDKTSPILGCGVYRVPCSCGKFYVGRTHQQLGERLHEHKTSRNKSLRFENKNDNFDSALAQHIYENPDHLVLFEGATLIPTVNGQPQYFKEAIEKKNINRNLAINRDTGDISLSQFITT